MRAAIFADQLFYKQPGGIGTYLRRIVPELAERLDEGSLVLAHHGPEDKLLFPGLEKVEEVRLPQRRDVLGMSWHTLGFPPLERYLGEFDLAHAPSLVYPPSRAPLVATIHDLTVIKHPGAFPRKWRHFHARGLKLILRHSKVVLCDSRSTYDDLCSLTGNRDQRMRVVPLGVGPPGEVDEEEVEKILAKHGLQAGYILFVGTLEPRKNLSRLVSAYAALGEEEKERSGELVLVGAPGWMEEEELSRLQAQPGVRRLGYLPQDELEAIYGGAMLFVYPSLYEGFGLPVLEAMARGLPVVTSRTSSMREVGEGAALLVDPADEREIRRAIQRLVDDEDLREELASKGRKRAADFTWDRTAELTLQAYKDTIG
jgi:glycosyltransferase involved in cell wall biosynthesis